MEVPVEADHQSKVPVIRRSEYTVYLEQATRHHTFIHCVIHVRWTHKVFRALTADFAVLRGLHGGPIYALHPPEDRKHHKFLFRMGFSLAESFIDSCGRPMEIYRSEEHTSELQSLMRITYTVLRLTKNTH